MLSNASTPLQVRGQKRWVWDAPRAPRLSIRVLSMLTLVFCGGAMAGTAPPALSTLKVPEPSNLGEFVANKQVAIALGKALFWDMRVGSDAKTACASCHFSAGSDPRSKNQVSPGFNGAGLSLLKMGVVNYQFRPEDFPFHKLSDPSKASSSVVHSYSAVASSQGVFLEQFLSIAPGNAEDKRLVLPDPIFNVGGVNTRQVEPRRTPTNINAVFNLRNFSDGRAQTIFNGVSGDGKRDANARVHKNVNGYVQPVEITLNDSSLASQAMEPPGSAFEMSAAGRRFADIGRKMYALRPLAGQAVAADDSVLGPWSDGNGTGLAVKDYLVAIQAAFRPEWWNGTQQVKVGGQNYSQAEANFSLFFGLAVQLYQATLVSDDARYDQWASGNKNALNVDELKGLGLFLGKGKCINCHGGATFSNAAIKREPLKTERMARMKMGDGKEAVYDEGFYNIGVTRTSDDPGVGGMDPWGRPLSFSGLARISSSLFQQLELDIPNVNVKPNERIAVNGAFKVPTLRNVELTAPYFHNGGSATLLQVVEFYNRGGNFAKENIADLDADIQPLGLKDDEMNQLVAFMRTLTDERVRKHAAPFDHPQLFVPNGQVGDTRSVVNDGFGRAKDEVLHVPRVGRNGYSPGDIPALFLNIKQ